MASSAGSTDVVKAGYWFVGYDNIRPVAEIPSQRFTHLYAGFAVVNIDTGEVTFPPEYEQEFKTFPDTVRQRNPTVKALLSIGGPGSPDISLVVRDDARRTKFIETSKNLAMDQSGYNGLDLCWLYPSPLDNVSDLMDFLKQWRGAVSQDDKKENKDDKFLLTAAVFYHPAIPSSGGRFFNYPNISVFLDWINVLAIDFCTSSNLSWETGPVHAWSNSKEKSRYGPCGSDGIRHWINSGVATNKLVLGLPFHGYEWILNDPMDYGFFAPAHKKDESPEPYSTIHAKILNNNFDTKYDGEYVATYSHKDRIWIGYDDITSIREKVTEAIEMDLGGYFAWHVGEDDRTWTLSVEAFFAGKRPIARPS
ncbi:class V chitinase-like [Carya illinoinensis]|uniref:GH18 domain-containing protein n=1 Tax=Carya illinoinensis TaxID=32201 RepID=A0A8T1NG11_CARIL|nr:class V chitinase-like [Carya illinoinensis]KAG6628034.1 hypothetical protein CIPAW_15G172100 [Carya illinoinensis]